MHKFCAVHCSARSRCARRPQEAAPPVPENVKADGVPPIPVALVDAVGPLRRVPHRQAARLAPDRAPHPDLDDLRKRAADSRSAIPAARARQLTFYRDGVTGGAWFEPSGRYFVFRKDIARGGEAMQLFRLDPATGSATLLTDGESRNGEPVWAQTRRAASPTTRRAATARIAIIYVMNPSEPRVGSPADAARRQLARARLVAGRPRVLVMESVSSSAETYCGRSTSRPAPRTR